MTAQSSVKTIFEIFFFERSFTFTQKGSRNEIITRAIHIFDQFQNMVGPETDFMGFSKMKVELHLPMMCIWLAFKLTEAAQCARSLHHHFSKIHSIIHPERFLYLPEMLLMERMIIKALNYEIYQETRFDDLNVLVGKIFVDSNQKFMQNLLNEIASIFLKFAYLEKDLLKQDPEMILMICVELAKELIATLDPGCFYRILDPPEGPESFNQNELLIEENDEHYQQKNLLFENDFQIEEESKDSFDSESDFIEPECRIKISISKRILSRSFYKVHRNYSPMNRILNSAMYERNNALNDSELLSSSYRKNHIKKNLAMSNLNKRIREFKKSCGFEDHSEYLIAKTDILRLKTETSRDSNIFRVFYE